MASKPAERGSRGQNSLCKLIKAVESDAGAEAFRRQFSGPRNLDAHLAGRLDSCSCIFDATRCILGVRPKLLVPVHVEVSEAKQTRKLKKGGGGNIVLLCHWTLPNALSKGSNRPWPRCQFDIVLSRVVAVDSSLRS